MNQKTIKTDKAGYTYGGHSKEDPGVIALSDINITIDQGQFVVVIGRNGSGKSTFARLMNALLLPTAGYVYLKGMDTRDENLIWDIRRTAGMVFQNPDNQIIGTTVEEDVAFGPENLGVEPEKIRERVNAAIKTVGIEEYFQHGPHLLSGGQKQRVAIAGILAMKPECIILDEATSMLDPIGRKELMKVLRKLNKEEGITIVHITHHMDEAALADRVVVINEGTLQYDGTPREVFSNIEGIKGMGLDVPQVTELFYLLRQDGFATPDGVLTVDEAEEFLKRQLK